MKKILLLRLIGILFIGALISSCTKEDDPVVDSRDQYVGFWNYQTIGSLTFYQNGSSIGTSPINESGVANVSKSSTNGLIIDDQLFFVNGSNLTSNPESVSSSDNDVTIVGTAVYSGILSPNIITINGSITGTWSNSLGASGNFSGTAVQTLTR